MRYRFIIVRAQPMVIGAVLCLVLAACSVGTIANDDHQKSVEIVYKSTCFDLAKKGTKEKVVVSREVAKGMIIKPENVELEEWDVALIPDEAIRDPRSIIGKRLLTDVVLGGIFVPRYIEGMEAQDKGGANLSPNDMTATERLRTDADTFFPLTTGSWWKYESTKAVAGPPTTSIVEYTVLAEKENPKPIPVFAHGLKPVVCRKTVEGATDTDAYYYYVVKDGYVCLLGENDREVRPPMPIVPLVPTNGQSWIWHGFRSYADVFSNIHRSVLHLDDGAATVDMQENFVTETEADKKRKFEDTNTYQKGRGLINHHHSQSSPGIGDWSSEDLKLQDAKVMRAHKEQTHE